MQSGAVVGPCCVASLELGQVGVTVQCSANVGGGRRREAFKLGLSCVGRFMVVRKERQTESA